MRKKELLREISALQARVKHLEECIKTQDRLLEGYQNREHAVVRAMQQVQEKADKRLAEAEEKARLIEQRAKQESSRLLSQTEATAAEYRDAIERYNAALEYAAAEAAANAERFASFVRGKKLTEGEIARETEGLSEIPFRSPVEDLPDPEGDPAQLMRNIYSIQNRVLPDVEETEDRTVAEPQDEIGEETTETSGFASAESEEQSEQKPERTAEELLIDALMQETPPNVDFDDDNAEGFVLPTVNAVLEQSAEQFDNTQELSLDDLLDEIIKSGEQYHG